MPRGMLTRRPSYSLASLLAELSDDDVIDAASDLLPDLLCAVAVVDFDGSVDVVDAAVATRWHASRLDD
jgi:hypothetical protein